MNAQTISQTAMKDIRSDKKIPVRNFTGSANTGDTKQTNS